MYAKRLGIIIALALAGVAFLAVGAQATTYTANWVGGSGTTQYDWNTVGNWSNSPTSSTVPNNQTSNPTRYYDVKIGVNNSSSYTPVTLYTLSPTVGSLSVALGYGLNIAGGKTLTLSTGGSRSGAFTNAGNISLGLGTGTGAGSGTLNFAGASTNSGTITLGDGTNVGTLSGAGTLTNSGTIKGFGTISDPVTNNGTVTANNATALNINGAFTNSLTGVLNAGVSTGSPTGTMIFGSTSSLSNSGAINVYGTLTDNNSSATWDLAPINLAGGTLNGTGSLSNTSTWSGYGTIGSTLNNTGSGAITVNDGKTLNIAGAFTNGTATSHTAIVNVGTSAATPPAVMNIDTGGTFTNNAILNIYGTLNNNTATAAALTALGSSVGSTATLAGGTLGGTGTGGFTNARTLTGHGNILTNFTNGSTTGSFGVFNADGLLSVSDITLTNQYTNASHYGILNLGSYTLDHTTAGTFTLAGGGTVNLAGGEIKTSGGGSMTNSNKINGYGTISAPMSSNSGAITANNASGPLTVSGDIASNTGGLSASGGTLELKSKISGEYSIVATNSSEVDLNGADLVGPTAFFHYITLGSSSNGSGAINLTGDSTWENRFQVNSAAPLNVNGHTLTLKNFTGSLPSGTFLNVGTGNLKIDGPAAVNSGGNIHLGGGNINYTTDSATDTLQANVIGFGDIKTKLLSTSGALATASGGTLYVSGGAELSLPGGTYNNSTLASSSGAILDLRSTINNSQPFTSYVNPNSGVVNLDGATLAAATGAAINLLAGTVNVTNTSTLSGTINSNATLGIDSGKTLKIDGGTLNVLGTGSIVGPGNVDIVGSGLALQNSNDLKANDFSMGKTATLEVDNSNKLILTGNFSFQQTDKAHAWKTNGTAGLGPNLKMAGSGTILDPQFLEVGGVNGNGMSNNFALNSLTITPGAFVELVDQFQNATTSGWTTGSEVLYMGSLADDPGSMATLDLHGIMAYVMHGSGFDQLYAGEIYNNVKIVDSSVVPLPGALLLLGGGLVRLAAYARRKRGLTLA